MMLKVVMIVRVIVEVIFVVMDVMVVIVMIVLLLRTCVSWEVDTIAFTSQSLVDNVCCSEHISKSTSIDEKRQRGRKEKKYIVWLS